MKTIITIIIVGFSLVSTYGQDLNLSIIKETDQPDSMTEHFYVIGVTNSSKKNSSFSITANNKLCAKENSPQIDFSHDVLSKNKSIQPKPLNIKPGETIEVYVKLSRANNTQLNTWNCTEIIATSNDNKVLSNALTIVSFIPDPKDFN
ncbi:hypothetical protein DFQ11_102443 [Winogradskyella epiphytica]|uniref:Fn3 domain-containing protein n=1 Tax=Winogradskyella epiphytica TaxID=262005 RepID=A0A2V4XFM7_9FLAO|nr:hypothetical protein [Winogradskyella epiphytica]PYE81865.1 hypothetical protein DFQ11_102443 [Winogradskyella epiphytica]GGW62109.1 hypothetical protein GCM10008085_12280 [Winogradskyella epiphytica]